MPRRTTRPPGQVTAFVAVLLLALLLVAGLVIDGGLTLSARLRAMDEAQAAARAGAQRLMVAQYRQGGPIGLDPAGASAAASAYLASTGDAATVTVAGDVVRVTVRVTQPMQLLSLVGVRRLTVLGQGQARSEPGALHGGS
jgi:Flp pilus assembly protein TadG